MLINNKWFIKRGKFNSIPLNVQLEQFFEYMKNTNLFSFLKKRHIVIYILILYTKLNSKTKYYSHAVIASRRVGHHLKQSSSKRSKYSLVRSNAVLSSDDLSRNRYTEKGSPSSFVYTYLNQFQNVFEAFFCSFQQYMSLILVTFGEKWYPVRAEKGFMTDEGKNSDDISSFCY